MDIRQAEHDSLRLRRILTEDRKFNPDQPRIPGGVHGGEWAKAFLSDVAADAFGNVRENGEWFDADGIYMTDDYVHKFGLPVTHVGFGAPGTNRDRYSVVLSDRGGLHIMRERDGGPSDALYTRRAEDVMVSGLDAAGARSLQKDLEALSDASLVNRPVDDTGEDVAGDEFGVGVTRVNAATGLRLTSAPHGAVIIHNFGGRDVKFGDGEVGDFISALDSMADEIIRPS